MGGEQTETVFLSELKLNLSRHFPAWRGANLRVKATQTDGAVEKYNMDTGDASAPSDSQVPWEKV